MLEQNVMTDRSPDIQLGLTWISGDVKWSRFKALLCVGQSHLAKVVIDDCLIEIDQ